ncbi:TraR/DksA family transcriptional regulator [Dyella sp. ASV21]|uniref:TraR/DksA family transcriptional regulator n=1 Tax=Dyella sp. ASV21 TaxID=2795114 RepID=UPI0018EAC035|nr:TraR/DksA family transcriptional regulator [Dyella sp. ASV21]
MPNHSAHLSPQFIEQQRHRLEALRRQVLGGEWGTTAQRRHETALHDDEAAEYEDEAQDSAIEEVRQDQRDIDARRIGDIERALQKINDGTYGFSDLSGSPIPQARLEATPEAILTVQEEALREARH